MKECSTKLDVEFAQLKVFYSQESEQRAQVEEQKMLAIKTSLKEKAILEELKAKVEAKMNYWRGMYVQEHKNNKRLQKEYVFIEDHQGELKRDIFHWQNMFNQQKSRAKKAKREWAQCEIRFKDL